MRVFRAFLALFISPVFLGQGLTLQAQKIIIDSSVYDKWESIVNGAQISSNGNYVAYRIKNRPVGITSLVVQSSDAKWKLEIPNAGYFVFCMNSKQIIYSLPGDSLALLTLGTLEIEYLLRVSSSQMLKNGGAEWLVYSLTGEMKKKYLRQMGTDVSRTVEDVEYISTAGNGINILFGNVTDDSVYTLKWMNLSSDSVYTVWNGKNPENFVFNREGTALAFSVDGDIGGESDRAFWQFSVAANRLEKLIDNRTDAMDSGIVLDRILRYSGDGNKLFFKSREKKRAGPLPNDPVAVVVWNYKDTRLPSLQNAKESKLKTKSYMCALLTNEHKAIKLESENESGWTPEILFRNHENIVLIEHQNIDFAEDERSWQKRSEKMIYLVQTSNGDRIALARSDKSKKDFRLSPDEKIVLYYDGNHRNYYSYQVNSGRCRNITQNIVANWDRTPSEYPKATAFTSSFSAWMAGGRYVLLQDTYDLWRVDLLAIDPPRNITNGYGYKHHIVFRPLYENEGNSMISDHSALILSAFNKDTKDNGFYSITLDGRHDPELLTMGAYMYYAPDNVEGEARGSIPVKAGEAGVYIVSRMSCTESPNYFSTKDFRTFTRLSNICPEKAFNWMTSELFTWKALDGRVFQGLLYKPENFDPKKKYPILFHYYERKSDLKNVYLEPEAATGPINIADYVSKGYLVATPDIHYTIGAPGESAVNAVVSAARYLSKKPWVDATKMGIQGFSFGGYQTNYIITHSHLFAAACSGASLSDLVSYYGWISPTGRTMQQFCESGQQRMGRPLSGNFELYIHNSPIFYTKNVTTPFLMMHTKMDGACPFENALEFYTLLRRLGKRVWLLQYNDGHHAVDGKSAIDYTIRMQQFFDFYLKGTPAPKWMVEGIPTN